METQNLLFDADDTLWESNIYFEQVIEEFLDYVRCTDRSRAEMRRLLDAVEHSHLETRGYGAGAFGRNLLDAFELLTGGAADAEARQWIEMRIARLENHEIRLLDGVPETLQYLAKRHRLVLLTKGVEAEQIRKVKHSGIGGFFNAVEVVREKEMQTYLAILAKYGFEKSHTWMVGNSPRSDINPALAAGIHAILIPHRQTWILEHEELPSEPERIHIIERFEWLKRLF